MTVAEKLQNIAENVPRIYDAGKKAEYDAFWDSFQEGGAVKDYSSTFGAGWTALTFRPKHDVITSNAYMMFRGSKMNIDLEAHLQSLGVSLDLSQAINTQYIFNTSEFTRVGKVDLSSSSGSYPLDSVFTGCRKLVTIDEIVLKTGSKGEINETCFKDCIALESLSLTGMITTLIDLQWSTKLSRTSIMSVLNAAHEGGDYFNDESKYPTVRLSLAAVNKAYETSEGANDGSSSKTWEIDVNNYHCQIELI